MNLQHFRKRALQNEEVRAEYENLNSEFELIDSLLTIRKKAGLTQEEIASKMGTKKGNISRLEKGGSNPNWKTLQNYAHACGYEMTMKFKHA